MSAVLALLNLVPRAVLYGLIAALLAASAALGVQNRSLQADVARLGTELAQLHATISQERADAAQAALTAVAAVRAEEQRRVDALRDLETKHEAERMALRADADRAAGAADRLRARLASITASLRAPRAGANPAPAGIGETGATIAELFSQCVDRYRSMAAEADAARSAGLAAERAYDALTPP
ncbi:MAG: DUF2514 family protein [Leptothrix sp. (in: b-proteobacteria)]